VTAGRCGPSNNGGDGREGGGLVPIAEEQWDGIVPGHGGDGRADDAVPDRGAGVEAVTVAVAWAR
jgi:hypothetical protein